MRKILPFLLVMYVLAISACHKPTATTGSLRMQLNPMFGSVPMRLNSTYQSPDGKYYNFYLLNMYLSHIRLMHADGSYVEVNPVVFIGLNDSTGAAPEIPLGNATGSFTAVQFSIGLDSVQNSTPVEYTNSNSPYYDNNMYWGTSLQYVFAELQAFADTSSNPSRQINYHLGTNAYYSTVTLSKTFTLTSSSSTNLVVNMDLQKLFYSGSNPINVLIDSNDLISTNPKPQLTQQLKTNLDNSFSIQ